jgi:hypothetical protein
VGDPVIPPDQLEMHRRFNRNSAACWDYFAEHRAKVTALLTESAGGRLVVLGAGNMNDLDVPQVAGAFSEVHLVDLDTEALGRGMGRQPEALRAALASHAPVDVTGSLDRLRRFVKAAPSGTDLDALIRAPAEGDAGKLPGPFDCVLSTCLLGQIMHSCRKAMGESPHLGVVAQAAAMGHLNLLGQLCRPGGTVLLVTDTVSSETYPLEELWGEQPPLELLTYLEKTDNTFSGTGPSYVRRLLNREPLRPQFDSARLVEPWLWRLGDKVTLLAYALVLRRKL